MAHVAFELARRRRQRVTSVDKANVLETSRLWRAVVTEVAQRVPRRRARAPLRGRGQLRADPGAARASTWSLTENLFGDILSDELAAVVGLDRPAALGLARRRAALYEPVHGSAPDLAGRGIANPVGAILSVAMLLEYSLGRPDLARAVDAAVATTLRELRTPDIGGNATTAEFTGAVLSNLAWARWAAPDAEEIGTLVRMGRVGGYSERKARSGSTPTARRAGI